MRTKRFSGPPAKTSWPRRDSGQILAEACIGLSLMVLVWVLVLFMTYMGNNRIRTAMAVRDLVWLQSNGEDVSSVSGAFFNSADSGVVTVPAQAGSTALALPAGIPSPWSANATTNTVTFGVAANQLSTTTQFPFVYLNTTLPVVGAPTVTNDGSSTPLKWNLLTVSTAGAWPSDTSNTYVGTSEAGFSFPSVP
jgi:hypothetical protein